LADLDAKPAEPIRLLGPAEREKASRFVFDRDRRRYLAAHGALRQVLATEFHWTSAEDFRIGAYGKPALPATEGGTFNLSHSGAVALIGVSSEYEIGVDIEIRRPITELDDLARRNFTSIEMSELSTCADEAQALTAFLRGWTRKEACLKALGSGLSIAPESFTVGLDESPRRVVIPTDSGWASVCVASLSPGAGMLAAVARRVAVDQQMPPIA
jgi:4'-phosphopantetheinyl transferase